MCEDEIPLQTQLEQEIARLSDEECSRIIRTWRRGLNPPTPEQTQQSLFSSTEWPTYDGDAFPRDYSVNIEHYLYGAPKQEESDEES